MGPMAVIFLTLGAAPIDRTKKPEACRNPGAIQISLPYAAMILALDMVPLLDMGGRLRLVPIPCCDTAASFVWLIS